MEPPPPYSDPPPSYESAIANSEATGSYALSVSSMVRDATMQQITDTTGTVTTTTNIPAHQVRTSSFAIGNPPMFGSFGATNINNLGRQFNHVHGFVFLVTFVLLFTWTYYWIVIRK